MPDHPDLRLTTETSLEQGFDRLERLDPKGFRALTALGGRPPLRARAPGFEGLVSIVVAQQVSTASAAAIFGRLRLALSAVTPDHVLDADDDLLRRSGLSGGKIRTLRAAAGVIAAGTLPLDRLPDMTADEAHRTLVAIKGIGPWTADVFLLFCLGHADAFPAGDLALQEAGRLVFGGDQRPTAVELVALAERWRPYRGVAAYLLWACYRAVRGRSGLVLVSS